ncbi:polysaccharide biosynthesis protein CapD [Luminiphilus syltensis NOR5-1B]|uniref:Polysaccharide biosynthesis protein CapD n=1 Tax=Luminiphilus syltensis NOR5-1B TaxID=565045 RepID=B8KX39_9GAMM|nr:nucleoside-diphosphate sugar epimerase/dehydratase [Luminiphilus syltensis]EED34796.1 polysaccharide biosynthesis protein CapD [Luminiphilus syltensis NOR5-1B]
MVDNFRSRISRSSGRLRGVGRHEDRQLRYGVRLSFLLLCDLLAVLASLAGAVGIGAGRPSLPTTELEVVVGLGLLVASGIIFVRQGLYRALIRYMGQQAVWDLVWSTTYSALVLSAMMLVTRVDVARTTPFVFWLLLFFTMGGIRLVTRAWHQSSARQGARNVVVYGAGESGRQLLHALNHGTDYRVVAFVDDDVRLHTSVINGRPVIGHKDLEDVIIEHDVAQVLLAIPSATPERRREIINSLVGMPVHVRTVPKISELVAGRASVNQIQDVDLDDLLGREAVPPQPELIDRCITNKVVMVTGAGGSIGSELCRQIAESSPRELILLDSSEYALYTIEREIRELNQRCDYRFPVVTLLGSVRDEKRLESIYRTFAVETVYHAAAYKHVPLVEYNISEGVANNVHGTWCAAKAAASAGVETFVLVSTDKAVRPTNVMGASKRFAELVLQALAQTDLPTRFCIVRFGNVLGSSGSVVPLFRQQIEKGGPLTVTHPEVSRYFMSIREAAQLVLQASAMGTGGDVFVLDMGEPVRIVDLAKRMIRLSGYDLGTELTASEHIDIEFIGLRPGEKLHEELLLGTSVSGTGHPMIMRAEEDSLSYDSLKQSVDELLEACSMMECGRITEILKLRVDGFSGHEPRYDYVWVKRGRAGKRVRRPSEPSTVTEFPVQGKASIPTV